MTVAPVGRPVLKSRGRPECRLQLRDRRFAHRPDVERDAVAGVDRHAHRGGRHVEVRHAEDLADLGVDLPLLAGPARLIQHVDLRDHAVGDAAMERRSVGALAVRRPALRREGIEPGPPGPAHRLVRGEVDRRQTRGVTDRRQRHDHRGGRAVRVRDQVAPALTGRGGVRPPAPRVARRRRAGRRSSCRPPAAPMPRLRP